jgi:hypothetical protein
MEVKAEELIVWARAIDRWVKAVQVEEERIAWAFRHALKREIADNEVDHYIKRLFVAWYFFGQPPPVIPVLDGEAGR